MSNDTTKLIREKIIQKLTPVVEIEVKDGKFSFPRLTSEEVASIRKRVELSPNKKIEVVTGGTNAMLQLSDDDKFQLVIP